MRFVVVTGMSGGGKRTALKMLEDLGFYCVDNLPVSLIEKFVELIIRPGGEISKVALGVDVRADQPFDEAQRALEQLRENGYQLPILVVTAKDTFPDKLKGFKLGIDDYMVKPIDVNELLLRVEALLRRAKIIFEKKLEFDHVCLDYINLTVTIDGSSQVLPQKEFQLLYKLLSFPNHTFTRQQIMDELWGYDSETDIRTVDVHIKRLREKIKDHENWKISTIWGIGYKFEVKK